MKIILSPHSLPPHLIWMKWILLLFFSPLWKNDNREKQRREKTTTQNLTYKNNFCRLEVHFRRAVSISIFQQWNTFLLSQNYQFSELLKNFLTTLADVLKNMYYKAECENWWRKVSLIRLDSFIKNSYKDFDARSRVISENQVTDGC